MPRPPRYQAYREGYEHEPSLVTCGVYFVALVLIGGILMYLLLRVFWGIL